MGKCKKGKKGKKGGKIALLCFLLMAVCGAALAQTPAPTPPPEPTSIDQVVGFFPSIWAAIKEGKWLLMVAFILNIIVFVIKRFGNWLHIPEGWRVPIITGLGIILAVVAQALSGQKWTTEWVLTFLAGPVAVWVHQLISRFTTTAPVPPPA